MNRRDLIALCGGMATLGPARSLAQQTKVPTIGILVGGTQAEFPVRFFRQGLHELGYIEGQNIRVTIRSAEDDLARLPELAQDLVREKVDVIAPVSTPSALAAKHATREIPIVMLGVGDPVASGIVASLARPGGNITGTTSFGAETSSKVVELLREAVPGLTRLAALLNTADPFSSQQLEQIQHAGRARQVEILVFLVKAGPELDAAFPMMIDKGAEAVIVQPTLPLDRAVALALRHRLPSGAASANFAVNSGLLSYSPNPADLYRSAAVIADKILRGAKPADLPIERSTRFRLVINLKTAKTLGLEIPPTLLARADEVIE